MRDFRFTLPCFQTTSAVFVAQDVLWHGSSVYGDTLSWSPARSGRFIRPQHFVYFHPSIRLISAIKQAKWLSSSSAPLRPLQRHPVPSHAVSCCLHRQDGNDAPADIEPSVHNDVSEGLNLGTNSQRRRRKEQLEEELFLASQRLRLRQDREILRIRAHRPVWTYVVSFSFFFITFYLSSAPGNETEERKHDTTCL